MHGERSKYFHKLMGINSRLDSLQAVVLSIKQRFLEQWCQGRIEKGVLQVVSGNGLMGIPDLSTGTQNTAVSAAARANRFRFESHHVRETA
jgi:dTDP-4-amino-4,6-dideoxygalactose transaminase